jgi:NAD(P)-dependent dehydrogenase (short-subunit alcohol dehydrogenase family)
MENLVNNYVTYADLKGKVAIVTGASKGIGKEIAKALGSNSVNVNIVDIDVKSGEETVKEFKDFGINANFYEMDVTSLAEINSVFDKVKSTFNKIDILVNNAGIVIRGPSVSYSEGDWRKNIDVMLNGVFFCSQVAGKYMIENKSGNIVNISSINAKLAGSEIASYCVAKAGVDMLTRVLAVEWAQYGIRVNSILPGVTKTEMVRRVIELGLVNPETLEKRTPMKRFANPKEIAQCILFLASDASSFMTGSNVIVDGGMVAWGYNI